jgi:Helix-hairpin-helix motif
MNRRKTLTVFASFMIVIRAIAQTPDMPEFRVEQLETQAEKTNAEPEDDTYELDMIRFLKHPMNMNTASEEELEQLHLLGVLQIRNFISYRKLLGPLLTVHELQAVPGWDLETIHRLLPYIMVGRDESVYTALKERWKGGDASFLIRAGQVLEKSKGFEKPSSPDASYYTGSPQKIFIRYTYQYKQLLAFGFTGEKDAGEPFFRSAQRYGFDFYSFHFFLQQAGIIRALAIGDFTVNLGQGLIQWQSYSNTKSSEVLAIKRESACLRPYHSAGEFNFHRGAAISLQKGKWQSSFFLSSQRISTNLEPDTAGREDLFSSFQNSGYHRTPTEIADRNNSLQISAGGNARYSGSQFMIGLNFIYFKFSRPFQKRDEPYNLFSLKGTSLSDYSLDYSYTHGNMHLFGEFALDQWRGMAYVQGALISLTDKIDVSFLYRNISPAYRSLYSDAFTENSTPNNEKGFYMGIGFKPTTGLQVNLFYDVFVFPWLKYRIDAPSSGKDLLIQTNYQPNKSWQLITLYKNEIKNGNAGVSNAGTHELATLVKQRWRIETDYLINRSFSFNNRMEFLWIKTQGSPTRQGFLGMTAFSYRKSGLKGNIGLAMFETDDYDSRIYMYEPDLLFNFSLPAYYGKGIHYYINLQQDFSRMMGRGPKHFRLSGWLKWGQTFYPGSASIGTGLDEIPGNRKSEIKAQVLLEWE